MAGYLAGLLAIISLSLGYGSGICFAADRLWREPVTGMEFVHIPGGCFMMGGSESYLDEQPVHEVCLDGFWMGKYEVTQREWQTLMGNDPAEYKGAFRPVENVDRDDVFDFIEEINTDSVLRMRLPTEAEWEYAARAGTTTMWYWGNDPNRICDYANVHDRVTEAALKFKELVFPCDDGYAYTAPVGSYRPNLFGLYDMIGNVAEMCLDAYSNEAYQHHSRFNPLNTTGREFVVRGGGRAASVNVSRAGFRTYEPGGEENSHLGFRLVREEYAPERHRH